MIIVTGSVTARPDSFEAMRQASLDHVHRSRTEDGCLLHSVQVDCENPLKLFFYEQWCDLASLQVHATVAGSKTFIAAVRQYAASSEPITVYEATPAALQSSSSS